MALQIEFNQLIGLALALLGGMFGAGRILLNLYDSRLESRFKAQEELRAQATVHWDKAFQAIEDAAKADSARFLAIERDISDVKVELAQNYVRREDHVAGQSRLEAKLDGLANRLAPLSALSNHA